MTMSSQSVDIMLSSIFVKIFCFSSQFQLLVKVSCQYHCWFWSYKIAFDMGLTRNRNTLIQVLPKILRLGELGISYLAQMFTIKCFWILKNARVTVFTTFTVSELLRETNSRKGVKISTPTPTHPDQGFVCKKGICRVFTWIIASLKGCEISYVL